MKEVAIRLTFACPSLGAVRRMTSRQNVIYSFLRDAASGRVLFLHTWWSTRMQFAAKVQQRCHALVNKIQWGAFVDGPVGQWRRSLPPRGSQKRKRYALHEAFLPGTTIALTAVLPDELTIQDFITLLTHVGAYKGISQFTEEEAIWGNFTVDSVLPTIKS